MNRALMVDAAPPLTARRLVVGGLQAVESSVEDDGHWGGFQLRNVTLMERHGALCFDAIAASYGFELEEGDVLVESRHRLDHPDDGPDDLADPITIRLDQLPLLAYPFGPVHQRPASTNDE